MRQDTHAITTFDLYLWPWLLDIGTNKWYATHRLVMMHVSMKFHEILKENGIFDIWPLFVTLTLEVRIYKWYVTRCLVMMHASMKEKRIFDLLPLFMTLTLEVGTSKLHAAHRLVKLHGFIFNRLEVVVRTSE